MKIRNLMLALGLLGSSQFALAHHPVCHCKHVEGGVIRCVGGFADGSGAPGLRLDVIGFDEKILLHGKLSADSSLSFRQPKGEFYILFDAGPGHVVEIDHLAVE